MRRLSAALLALGILSLGTATSQASQTGKKAPELDVDTWVHLPEGQAKGPTLHEEWKGKVVYLYFFQSWCPGCHSSGFPTLQKLKKEFSGNDGIRFATVQTVFEGFHTNTEKSAKEMVERYDLQDIPVGHSGSRDKRSAIMQSFRTRGTPWTVLIGKDGLIRTEGFHVELEQGKKVLQQLLDE